MSSTRHKLITLLSKYTDDYISGQTLSEQLNISRSAIWKHMKELEKDGYVIEGKSRKGYRIVEFPDKLSENTIQWGLKTNWLGKNIIHKVSIPSTQTMAHKEALDHAPNGTVIVANEQTAGKGRIDHYWHSQNEKGIWLSMILRPNLLPYQAPQLTLLTATVIADVIQRLTELKPQIKWPNDILINRKKIAGILTEMQAEQDQILYVVIGIGLNVLHTKEDFPDDILHKATSLKIETREKWNIKQFIQEILETFEKKYETFINQGFPTVKKEWEFYGFRLHEQIKIKTRKASWHGRFLGISEDGALIVKHQDGRISKVYSGEIAWFEEE